MNHVHRLFTLFFTIHCLIAFSTGWAQTPHQNKDFEKEADKSKIESMKVAYITNKLDLTPEEARKFWPVYNEWQDKKEKAWKAYKAQKHEEDENFSELSDQKLNTIIEAHIAKDQKKATLQREYLNKIKNQLPLAKVVELLHAEHTFKQHLLDKRCADDKGAKKE